MDLEEWSEPAELERLVDEETDISLNVYQKTEEQVMSLFEKIKDMVQSMSEPSLLYDLTMEDVARLLYSEAYLVSVKQTEPGSKLF
jgi:hypothetical protein